MNLVSSSLQVYLLRQALFQLQVQSPVVSRLRILHNQIGPRPSHRRILVYLVNHLPSLLSLHQSVQSPVVSRLRTQVHLTGQHHSQAVSHRHNLLNNPRLHRCHPHSLVLSHPLRLVISNHILHVYSYVFISANTKVVIYISQHFFITKHTTSHHYSITAIGESFTIRLAHVTAIGES